MKDIEKDKRRRPGRPRMTPGGARHVVISIPAELVDDLRCLGGSRWVREQIIKAKSKPEGKSNEEKSEKNEKSPAGEGL